MFTKKELQKLGFDFVDQSNSFSAVLTNVNAAGAPVFKQAYAYGLGMILNFNQEYIARSDLESLEFRKPEYLHLVFATESAAKE